MFSDSTLKLMRVMGTYQSWLGHSYTTMLQAFECEGKPPSAFQTTGIRLPHHAMDKGLDSKPNYAWLLWQHVLDSDAQANSASQGKKTDRAP